jgi:2,4-dienoyl-CoA reductase-like NADH-dependent reductase (Old Yellow Enzyme family)
MNSSNIFTPTKLGGLKLRNRVMRAGCFEGMCQNGAVTPALIEHHRRVAQGGVGLTTVAYCSVSYDGRAFGHEMWMRSEIVPDLRRLTDAVHTEGAAVSLQIGHCGFFSNPREIQKRPLGASPKLCLFRLSICQQMTQADIDEKIADFARTASLAKEAGFDALEIHAGHGYLLAQFLSPWTNWRTDAYGGSLENRLRFPLAVIRAVRQAVGPEFPLLVKMNQEDGFPGGLTLDEAVQVAQAYETVGVNALVPSCGFTARTPLYMMRGDVPTREMARNQEQWLLRLGMTLFGRFMVQHYRFEPLFLLEGARRIQQAVQIPVVYIGGVLSLKDMEKAMEEGFGFLQVGRAIIRDPDFVNHLQSGEVTVSDCDHCNRCIASMDAGGVYCVTFGQPPMKM